MELKRSSYHWCSYCIHVLITSHLWSCIDSENEPGYSINVSEHVTVQRGLCVYIPCQFTMPETATLTTNASGIWIHSEEQFVASNKEKNINLFYKDRFFFVGDIWKKDCSLYIEDLTYEHEGTYRFRVEDIILFSYRDVQPFVEVTDLTDSPEISPVRSWVEGEDVTLTCTAPGKCMYKTPKINWEGNIENRKLEDQVTIHKDGTKTHFSTITFTVRKEQNNTPLSCIVQVTEGLTTSQQITIKVEYPPRALQIKCSIMSKKQNKISNTNCVMGANNTLYILMGSQLSLTCSADSVPKPSLVWWKASNQTSFSRAILTFKNILVNDEGYYTCQAKNDHGTRETSVTIRVTYAPRQPKIECSINSKKQSNCSTDVNNTIYSVEGSQLFLTCSADSVPKSFLVWESSKNSHQKQASSTDKLTFSNLSLNDEGLYICRATNDYGATKTSVSIKVTYPPRSPEIKCSIITKEPDILFINNCTMDANNTIDVLEGSQLSLTCSVDSVPESSLMWKFSNQSTLSMNKLTFANVSRNDEGIFRCEATNTHGTKETSVSIRVTYQKNPLLAAAIYGGCVAAVLIVIGILFKIFYKKRKTMQKKENSSQNQVYVADHIYENSEMFSNGSHEVGEKDRQQLLEDESTLNDQEVQYISLDFSRLKSKDCTKEEEDNEEEIEYAEVKRTD